MKPSLLLCVIFLLMSGCEKRLTDDMIINLEERQEKINKRIDDLNVNILVNINSVYLYIFETMYSTEPDMIFYYGELKKIEGELKNLQKELSYIDKSYTLSESKIKEREKKLNEIEEELTNNMNYFLEIVVKINESSEK